MSSTRETLEPRLQRKDGREEKRKRFRDGKRERERDEVFLPEQDRKINSLRTDEPQMITGK